MKNQLYKVLFLILVICTTTVKLNAQTTGDGKISAKVVDAQTNETIPFASAVVLNKKTKAMVKSAQTDVNGNLVIPALPKGVFTFKISYVGYQTMVRDSVSITATAKEINLGTIKMRASKGTVLQEVAITAQKNTLQMGVDKKVFSVDQSLVSQGGSASDLLQNIPSVQADVDGNISLRGSTGVKVLIDGKTSLIAGGDVAQILQSIPASSIESVELITNPSSKYDAEGQSGIINIVLKKNKKLGFNGNVALTAGNRDNYNASTNVSFQNSKFNAYGNYSYRYGNRPGGGFNNIFYKIPNFSPTFADQNTDSKGTDKGHNVKAGFDYYLNPKSTLSFTGGFNIRDNDRTDLITIDKLGAQRNPLELSKRNNTNNGSGNSYDLNLDFSHKFKKPKEEITFNAAFSEGTNDNLQFYNTDIYNVNGVDVNSLPDILRNTGTGLNRNYNFQADYSLPVGKTGKIEAGYRSQIRIAENNTLSEAFNNFSNDFDINLPLTNTFNSKDQVHALYANYQNSYKKFGYQIGLRAEDATLNTRLGRYDNSSVLSYVPGKVAYTRLYPSVFLTQKFNGEQQLQLSYTRRVNRPRGWDTNPFLDVSDPLNYRRGNPNLKPEDVHSFELAYSKFWPKVTLVSTVYLRQTNDVIQRIRTEPDQNGITITTPENLNKQINSGLELIARVDVAKAWNFTANANFYQNKIFGTPAFGTIDNSGFTWDANLTNNFVLPYNITLQVRGDYRAKQVLAQGTRNPMYGVDAGAKYDFKNKKSSLSFNIRDIFRTRAWSVTTTTNESVIDFKRYMIGQVASLTYSYRFGKTDFSQKRKRPDQQESRPDEESF